ncbi:MAG: nucleotide exchange factor GrpE [Actinobacteria bacterium]|nr:nucleotide exchange factor GrpE [Actinomycetota bacterium]
MSEASDHDVDDAGDQARSAPSGDWDPEAFADSGMSESTVDEDLARERDEMRALAQRVQADFENYKKRVQRDQAEASDRGASLLVEQLLPVLDNFDLALLNLDDADDKVRKGVELVYADFVAVLERAGLERIPTDGQPFDPEVHEAVLHEPGDGDPTVVETMRSGYRLKGRVLRPAMVKVSG